MGSAIGYIFIGGIIFLAVLWVISRVSAARTRKEIFEEIMESEKDLFKGRLK